MNVPSITLRDGNTIPQLGLGVFKIDPAATEDLVTAALQAGYRHIDTAAIYGNEAGVGRAIGKSGIPREELFITTKLWNDDQTRAPEALDESLAKLGLDYVDLYLIHWPVASRGTYVQAWKDLVQLKQAGKTRSIGVSNFQLPHLEELEMVTSERPVINQVELHPYLQRWRTLDPMRDQGIKIQAWGPLGQGKQDLLADDTITEIATTHGVSPAQVVIRWHLQNGIILFPKSTNQAHLEENLQVFDFELSGAELAALTDLDRDEDGRGGAHPDELT